MTDIKKDEFWDAVATLMEKKLTPRVIHDQEEADKATKSDPSGHIWHVGEEYYLHVRGKGFIA